MQMTVQKGLRPLLVTTFGVCFALGLACSSPGVENDRGTGLDEGDGGETDRCAGVICNAAPQCHVAAGATCDPTTGSCVYPLAATGTGCNADTDGCTEDDACNTSGVCVKGTTVKCNSPPNTGCYASQGVCQSTGNDSYVCNYSPVSTGTSCTPTGAYDHCLQTWACDAAHACTGSTPKSCVATACFTGGTCDPSDGTCHGGVNQPPNAGCSDGLGCTAGDHCDGNGSCVAGAPLCVDPLKKICVEPGTCQAEPGLQATLATALHKNVLEVRNVATDLAGNVYIAGFFGNAATDVAGVTVPFTGGTGQNLLVAALAPSTFQANWAKSFGDPSGTDDSKTAYGHGVAVTSTGTVVVYGSYRGNMTIGTPLPAAAVSMEFVAALDASGAGLWSHGYDLGDGVLLAIAGSLEQNALAVCGPSTIATTSLVPGAAHCSALTAIDPTSCGTPATCDGSTTSGLCDPAHIDIVVAKLNPTDGNVLWSRQIGGAGNQLCSALAIDPVGNVIIAGTYNGTLDLAPGGTSTPWSITFGRSQMYVARLDGASGQTTVAVPFLNGTAGGGLGTQAISGVSIDGNGDIVIAGAMNRTVAFSPSIVLRANGPSATDVFAVKLSGTDLNPLWGRRWGDNAADVARGVSVDSMGQVYVVGEFYGNADVGMGADDSCSLAPCTPVATPITSASPNAADVFVVRLHGTTGATMFAKPYGDVNGQSALGVVASRLATNTEKDAVQVVGTFTGQIDFGLVPPLSSESIGIYDVFLARFK